MIGHIYITLLAVAVLITVSDGQPNLIRWNLDLDNNKIILYFAALNPSNNGMPTDCTAILIGSISGDISMAIRLLPSVTGLQVNNSMVTCDLGMKFRHILDYVLNASDYFLYYNSSGMTNLEFLIQDSHGVVYENTMGILAAEVVLDGSPPALISFELLDLNDGKLVLSFSQPINVTTLNFAYLSLLSSPFNETMTIAISLSDGNCSDGCEIGRRVTLSLESADFDRLKLQDSVCANISNCYLYYTGAFVEDFGGNSIAKYNYFTEYLPQNLTLDKTFPSLNGCNLDLSLDQLSLEFDEPIDASSFNPNGINISTTVGNVILTSASILKGPSDSVIVIYLGLDADNIKTSLSIENDNISVSLMSLAFKDIAGNSIHPNSMWCTFNNDTISPNVSFFILDLNSNLLQVIFDEPVLMEHINISGFKLTDAMSITTVNLSDSKFLDFDNLVLFNGCNGLYHTNKLRTVYIALEKQSLTTVKTRLSNSFTFLLIDDGSIFDWSGNDFISAGLIAAADVIEDNSPATLVNFSLDMNIGQFVLTFSDVVDVSTLQIYEMSIQTASYDTGYTSTTKFTPIGVYSSMNSSIFQSDFTGPGLIQLKYRLLRYNLATDINSTYLTMSADAIDDIRGVDIIAITNGNGIIASNYIRDSEPPVLTSFNLDMDSSTIWFTFDEPINPDRFNFTLFLIQADSVSITNTSTNFSLNGGYLLYDLRSFPLTEFRYLLSNSLFLRSLYADPSVVINNSTTNLVIMQGGVFDASGNPINTTGPISVNDFTPRQPARVHFYRSDRVATINENSRQQLHIRLLFSYSLSVTSTVQVNNTDGTTSDSDYRSGPYTVIFPAGSTSASLYINITDDNIVENNENFVLYIDPLTLPFGTYIISYGSQITVTIYDNDNAIVNFINSTYNVIEDNGVVQLMLNLTNPLSRDISVQVISTDGLATGNIDYNSGPYNVTFIAGMTTASLNISIIEDDVLENNENFFLTINQIYHNYSGFNKITIDTTDRPIVNIVDDDFTTVEFNQSTYRVNEDDGSIEILLVLSNPSSFVITADVFSTSDSATGAGIDYSSGPYTITFVAGTTATSFRILITDDSTLEGNETFYLTIDPSSLRDDTNVDVGSLFQVTVIIVEDDFVIVNFDQSAYSIDEDDGPFQPVLVLSNPSAHLINIQVNSTDGSAIGGGVNYFSGPYLVAFPPEMTTSVITVQINDDRYYESNSLNFTLTITSDELNNNIVIGETGQTTVTIIDDESKSDRVSFTQSVYSIAENSGSIEIQLIYSDTNSSNFTVQVLSVGGSATGEDYQPGPYTVEVPAEMTSVFFNISITNDEIFEANETFDLIINVFSLPLNVTIGDIGQATVIILNDDELRTQRAIPYIVNFDQSMYSIDENSGPVMITVVLDEPPSTDITVVVFTTDGSATGNGQDYNSGRYDITFNVGVANVSFGIPIIDDQIFEEDELFILGLCSLPNSVITGNFSQATVTILNDDISATPIVCTPTTTNDITPTTLVTQVTTVEFNQSAYRVTEDDGSIQILLVLSNPSSFVITADVFSTSDSATGAGIDYNSGPYTITFVAGTIATSFRILITDDSILEGNETFYLTIDPSSLRDDTNVDVGSLFQVTVIIVEDDFVIVNFDQSTYSIDEDDGPFQSVLVLSNPSAHLINVQVNSTDGSAIGGGVNYFSGPYLVAFPAGMTTAVITVQINDDSLYESNSLNFTLTITSDELNNNVVVGETDQTTVTIIDDESKSDTVSFTQSIYSIAENSGSIEIQLIYSDSNSSNFTIQVLSVCGSATGEDYQPGPYTVEVPAEMTSVFFNISITNDEIFEANETFDLVVNVSSLPLNVTIGDIGQATVIILNDDELQIQRVTPYIVNFDQSMYSIDENSGPVMITVVLDEPPSTNITVVVFTTDGSATGNGQDYNSGRYNITFNVGVANVSFGVPIIDDQIFEEDELFILGLCSLPNSVIIGNFSQATVTILNDDTSFIAQFNATEYEIDIDIYSPVGTVVFEALFIINPNVIVEYLSFDIIMMDEMIGESSVEGYFLINGTTPPLVQEAPFQSMYFLTITTDNVLDTDDTMDITFNLFAFINISTGVLAMPVSNVILHKIVSATPIVCTPTTTNDITPTTLVTQVASLYFSESTYDIKENAGPLKPVLILNTPSLTTFTVQVLSTTSDPAIGDDDYDSGPYTVTFPSGVTNVSFDIMISDNNLLESDETFYLIINSFSLPHNITITDPGQAIAIIVDDDSTPDCPRENDSTIWQIEWNSTKAGDTANQNCPDSPKHYARRNCHLNGSWDALINVTECQSADLDMLIERIEDILNSTVVNITDLSTISRDLSIITNTSGIIAITPENLNTTNSILSSIISIINNISKENTASDIDIEALLTAVESTSTTIDNLLSDSNRESYEKSNIMELPVAEDLLRNTENFNIAFGNVVHMNYANNSEESSEYNMMIQRDNIIFNAQNPELVTEYVMFGFNNTDITIPANTIRNIKGERVPIVSFICNNLLSYLNDTFKSEDGEEYTGLRSGVIISSQISNGFKSFLGNSSVILNFVHNLDRATSTQCVFWDFNLTYTDNEPMGGWSTEGIIQDSDPSSPVMCNSTHLTSFAVLVSAEGGDNFQSITGLKVVSYIGCAISIVCLLLTIIAIVSLKKCVFKDKIYMVHLNLAIALLLGLIVFVSGVETAKNHRVTCILVTSLLHYLFLAVFAWALCEGICIYVWFVAVFYKGIFQRVRIFLLLGWGLPIPIAVVSAAVSYNNYGIKNDSGETIACWISDKDGAIWAFIGPMIAMICINACFLIIALMRIYLQRRNFSGNINAQSIGTARTLIMITLALQPLLCGTWILGLFFLFTLIDGNSNPELSEALSWIFTLVNSLQGFLIFYLYVVRKKGKLIIKEIQEIYRRQRKIRKFKISGKSQRNVNADKSGTLLSYFTSSLPHHTEFETSTDVKKSTIIKTLNSDHNLVAPAVQHSFNEYESETKDNVTEPNSQEQEFKALNESTPKFENKIANESSDNKLQVHATDHQSSIAVPYYTGASFTSGYNQVKAYIIMQSPMADTVKNFWRMIIETQCPTIIMLCDLVEDNQEVCCCYWPWQGGTNVHGEIEVKYFGGSATKHYTVRYMEVTDIKTRKSHRVTQFQFHGWLDNSPPNNNIAAGLMSMIADVQKVQYMYNTSDNPVAVHCSTTLSRSSTFCAIFTALKQLRASQSTDVFQLVESFYTNNPGVAYNTELHQFASQAIQQRYMRSHKAYEV